MDKVGEWDLNRGIDVGQALTGTLPESNHKLKWGENIPPDIYKALENGETATLYDAENKPYSLVLMDHFGTIKENKLGKG